MTDKYEDLKSAALEATPGPWRRTVTRFNGITNSTHSMASFSSEGVLANANEKRDAIFIAEANPAVILSLLAELEEKDKSISSLIDLVTYAQEGRNRWEATAISNFEECERMSKRIKELEDYNDKLREWNAGLAKESCELQAKLATPVVWEIDNPGEGTYYLDYEPQEGDYRRDLIVRKLCESPTIDCKINK